MKFRLLLAVYAAVYGSIVSAGATDRYRTQNGAECMVSYENNHKIEFGVEGSPQLSTSVGGMDLSITPFVKYTYSFGANSRNKRLNCHTTQRLEEQRMKIDNDRLLVELELLREQLSEMRSKMTIVDAGPIADEEW